MAIGVDALKRSPLHDRHVAAGARMVPFAGWEMPVQYEGIRAEHVAVRRRAGVFDVSHMGEVETTGPDAEAFLQRILSNDVSRIADGGAQYSVLCRDDGGVLDDLFTYRLGADRSLPVANASHPARDPAWLRPHARGLVGRLADAELPGRFKTAVLGVAGAPDVLVCGTGYTGEDGVELLVAPEAAASVWDAVVGAGAPPAGLGARDTLRL